MTFAETLGQVRELLQSKQRVSYRALKRQFALEDDYLEDLKAELIDAERVAVDEDGKVLVWVGNAEEDKGKRIKDKGRNGEQKTEGEKEKDAGLRTPDPAQSSAERRQLTVMFIDLVGSTTLSQQLDPEEYHARVIAYQAVCQQAIQRYEGHIAQYLGDGVLVYFGYPAAHEEDATRAVRSGLEVVTAVRQMAYTPPLQVRIGIHTGPVVVGEIGAGERMERLALGETPNIAARVQGIANPDEVVISAATYRLVEGLFAVEERGQPDLKSIATPLTLYRVVREGEAHSRFEVVMRKGLTPLIGREHEYGLLRERWEQVKDGSGQVVLLSGEPGIGKSRLVEALKTELEHEETRCLELRCSPYTQNSALAPVIEHLQRTLQFRPEDTANEKLQKLIVGAQHAAPLEKEAIPLLAALLSLPHPDGYPPLTLSPQRQKEKTHEALVAWLGAEAKQQAVTYAWEDLHWADPSTLELLTLFLQQVPTTRLLAVFIYRPEFTPPWGVYSYLSQINLSRLGRSHVETMVEKVTGGKALPKEVVQQIVSKTDGIPLFVEELTKSMVEAIGARRAVPLQMPIPATLHDALMARLDRLGSAKDIAQIGATLGREFNYELLQAVSLLNEATLQQGLKQLVESELVYQSGIPPQARYLFKHALVQDTAYQSLLKSRRQQLHQLAAQVLERQFPQMIETQPELVAHHYTEAGLIKQAIPYWQQAGQRAIQRSANEEAVTHLTTGIELLKALPDTPERMQQELTLQTALGTALLVTKGLGAHEVREVYDRARHLCNRLGDTPQLFSILRGLSGYYLQQDEMLTSIELAQQCLALAEKEQDTTHMLIAHTRLVSGWFFYGEPERAHEHCERGMALYDFEQHHSLAFIYGVDGGVPCLPIGAWALWYLGYPEQALKRSQAAVALARRVAHPFSLAWALEAASWLHWYRREGQEAYALADEAVTLSLQQEFPHWIAMGLQRRGEALRLLGQWEEGTTQLQQGLEGYRATGAAGGWARGLAELARSCLHWGQYEEGLRLADEALELMNQKTQRHYAAEQYRIKGELLRQKSEVRGPKSEVSKSLILTPNSQAEAEEYFLKAIEIAQSQKAKSWELRAATSLARLWQHQGKKAVAHKLLSEVYTWFTEGFDTKDLQEAKALLEELSHYND